MSGSLGTAHLVLDGAGLPVPDLQGDCFFIEAEDWPHHNWYAAHRRANATNGLPVQDFAGHSARVTAAGPLTAPVAPIVPMRIQSLKGRPAGELLAIEDEGARPERWALRREYRSSFRDAPSASERRRSSVGAWRKRV